MIKVCSKCGEEKPLSGFRKDRTQKSGYQPRCKVCARSATNESYSKYKDKAAARYTERDRTTRQRLAEYKSSLQCQCCGENTTVCLDFHHIDPSTKSFQLSNPSTRGWEAIMEEVAKCVVVCKNCHTKIHAGLIAL